MARTTIAFDDALAYEHFMGRWSRALGGAFLEWLAPPKGACWLDVGCGTGAFTQLLLDSCAPASVAAVDFSASQIDYARQRLPAGSVDFRVADAQALPFPDNTFDTIASGLVLNFIPDGARALSEMRRVCRPGGYVAGYVWDFAGERSSAWPLRLGLREINVPLPTIPGTEHTSIEALHTLFTNAGFEAVVERSIEVTLTFASFEDYWRSQTPAFTPQGKIVAGLPNGDRTRLKKIVQRTLPATSGGGIAYAGGANAVKARRPPAKY
jgi:ubiquinone/menaquinone biosynthesis C-methylase UbiE